MQPVIRLNLYTWQREMVLMRWGLVPFFSKEPTHSYSTINARAESILGKPIFREPMRKRRCLVPVNSYFEWQTTDPDTKKKQPWAIGLASGEPHCIDPEVVRLDPTVWGDHGTEIALVLGSRDALGEVNPEVHPKIVANFSYLFSYLRAYRQQHTYLIIGSGKCKGPGFEGLLQDQSEKPLRDKSNRGVRLRLIVADHSAALGVEPNKTLAFNLTAPEYY
jgi:hypothetical protein